MDTELVTQVLALLTAAWTAWQEYRHRKVVKELKASEMLKAKPVKR
jgi:hypothetical protein